LRPVPIAALLAALSISATADAQNSLVTAKPLAGWTRGTPGGAPEAITYKYDDGGAENAIGIQCGVPTCNPPNTTLVWAHYFDTNDPLFAGTSSDTITRIDVAFGSPPGPTAPPAGSPYDVYIFDDPNDDGNPADLLGSDLVTSVVGTLSVAPDTNTLEQVAVPPGVVQGGFFVLAAMVHQMSTVPATPGVGKFPAGIDTTTVNPPAPPRVWANCFNGTWVPTNPQATNCGGWINLAGVGFNGVWLFRAEGTGTGPTNFCTSKAGLVCGPPAISASGVPSASMSSGFVVTAAPARNNKSGILVYNTAQVTGLPFNGGTLCVDPMGLRRAGSTNSGAGCGANNCSGLMSIDMNAFSQGDTGLCAPNPCWVVPDCNGAPSGIAPNNAAAFLLSPGTVIFAQYWGRDSVATGSLVSNGITYTIGP
jgi:hypothetical protein